MELFAKYTTKSVLQGLIGSRDMFAQRLVDQALMAPSSS